MEGKDKQAIEKRILLIIELQSSFVTVSALVGFLLASFTRSRSRVEADCVTDLSTDSSVRGPAMQRDSGAAPYSLLSNHKCASVKNENKGSKRIEPRLSN